MKLCDQDAGLAEAEIIARRIRVAVYLFTLPVLIPAAMGLGVATLLTQVRTKEFWILYTASVVLIFVALLGTRQLIGRISPVTAISYYCSAALDRLLGPLPLTADTNRYLAIVLPTLEQVLLGTALRERNAGTSIARRALCRRQHALAAEIGSAETRLATGAADAAAVVALQNSLGKTLVAIQTGAWRYLPDPAIEESEHEASAGREPSWWANAVASFRDKGIELVLASALAILPLASRAIAE